MGTSAPSPGYTIRQATITVPGSKPGTTYTVVMDITPHSLTGRAVNCTCPDHRFRHRACRHMLAAEQGRAGKPSLKLGLAQTQRERDLEALASMYAD